MTNPTRQEIIDAHYALENLEYVARKSAKSTEEKDYCTRKRNLILRALPTLPRPTMAEIEWNDDKHYLAEAKYEPYGSVIMLGPADDGLIEFFSPRLRECRYDSAYRGTLTLTGKRYTLAEVQE